MAEREIEVLRRPVWWLRALSVAAVLLVLAAGGWAIRRVPGLAQTGVGGLAELLQGLDAATNLLVVLALTLVFLSTLEGRLKRRGALRLLHRLRSMAHVVDMHQLTKDPEHVTGQMQPTTSSPERTLSRAELTRYLGYCSEMLALISKLAALHAERLQDSVVLETVNDVEALTNGLSAKIWQKLMILSRNSDEQPRGEPLQA